MKKVKELVHLPVTEADFDALVSRLMTTYKLPSEAQARSVLIRVIMHLPVDQDTTTLKYLASNIRKNLAYQLAEFLGKKDRHSAYLAHKAQVDDLVAILTADRADAQALNTLEGFVKEGSVLAKEALKALGLSENGTAGTPSQPDLTAETPCANGTES